VRRGFGPARTGPKADLKVRPTSVFTAALKVRRTLPRML
jgi:hypothetical protein